MGKKSKTGKQRKDKFYHLAKETGYRARSAFKLIQLNRKFGFLNESRVLVDLCAAPGGWLQVAAKHMPVSSVVIGIDLVAIKSIENVSTFQADITTEHCRQLLKKELKTWKADVVLNDGAPNVGTAWVQDAFSQAQLALSALKLASDYLKKDGWFITKLFRSKDYTALLWVFQQLFRKVHSTKPQASRNESAEIFVVCQGFLAPDKLDEKFLDPKHVFKEIESESKVRLDILRPEKRTRQREGYPENNITLHTAVTARQFLDTANAVDFLSTTNKIDIVEENIKNHPATTDEVVICCRDIKVLGRKEIKTLFSWRKKLRKDVKNVQEDVESIGETTEEGDGSKDIEKTEEEELDQMVTELKAEEAKDVKKKKKRVRELKKKLRERLAMKLEVASGDTGMVEQDLFALDLISNKQELDSVGKDIPDNVEEDSASEMEVEDDADDSSVDSSDEEYVYGADELYEELPKKKPISAEEPKLKKRKKKSDNPLLVDIGDEEEGDENVAAVNKAKQWYQKDVFKGIEENEDELDDDYDIEQMLSNFKKKGGLVIEKTNKDESLEGGEEGEDKEEKERNEVEDDANDDASNGDENVGDVNDAGDDDSDEDDDEDDEDDEDSDDSIENEVDDRSISEGKVKPIPEQQEKQQQQQEEKQENQQQQKKPQKGNGNPPQNKVHLDAEDLALGAAIATSRKRKRDIIDGGYNRYSFNDDNLPSWFTEDENKHNFRHIPITREEVEFYKQRMRDLNARPIKKVIEAKAKKKSKMLYKLDKVRTKAQGILDAEETSLKEKQSQIKGIYKKAGLVKKRAPKPTFVVAKKGLAGKNYKRPSNVKGSYKVVDPRMKKDLRAMKGKEKTKGRRKTR